MLIGKVIGTVVATEIYEGMTGVPLLLVQPMAKDGTDKGHAVVCADGTRMAGPGERVYYEGGREAAMTLNPSFVPVDHAIVGLVDGVEAAEWKEGAV